MDLGERLKDEAMKLTQVPEVLAVLQRKGVVEKLQEAIEEALVEGEESRRPGYRDCLKVLLGVMGRH